MPINEEGNWITSNGKCIHCIDSGVRAFIGTHHAPPESEVLNTELIYYIMYCDECDKGTVMKRLDPLKLNNNGCRFRYEKFMETTKRIFPDGRITQAKFDNGLSTD